jgi:predicted nicotinamide N-methyase
MTLSPRTRLSAMRARVYVQPVQETKPPNKAAMDERDGSVDAPARASRSAFRRRPDPTAFIQTNTHVLAVPTLPAIRLHTAHEATGLWRLSEPEADGSEPPPPYWAFPWAGGMALARHIFARPETVAGRRILDLGTGSGLVAIAAALAGACSVIAADIDAYAIAAATLNAAVNGISLTVVQDDLTVGAPPPVDVVTVGDLFYEAGLAASVTAFLDRCLAAGIEVLIGDPRRAYLPYARVRLLAEYPVPDVGDVEGSAVNPGAVFALQPAEG